MKYKKWALRLMFALMLMVLALMIFLIIEFFCCHKPLRLTTLWDVKVCTHAGNPMPFKTYKMSGYDVFFVNIEGGPWFSVDFSDDGNYATGAWDKINVHISYPLTFPCLHYPNTRRWGLDILCGKLDEMWYLTYTGDTLVFSNKTYFVSMTQENSGRPPVEVHRSTFDYRWK